VKKRLLAASCLVSILVSSLAINPAAAADLAARPYTKAPATAVAVYNWTGFYLGANAGYGWGHSDEFAAVFGTRANFDISGGLAGGQVGYNWQAGAWVFGVEVDGDWADIDGAVRCPNPAFSCTAKVRDLASFRGRVGWATGGLIFGTVGKADLVVALDDGVAGRARGDLQALEDRHAGADERPQRAREARHGGAYQIE
jgi:outer membrane immunogenic protein